VRGVVRKGARRGWYAECSVRDGEGGTRGLVADWDRQEGLYGRAG
jgi:hypothetical protein